MPFKDLPSSLTFTAERKAGRGERGQVGSRTRWSKEGGVLIPGRGRMTRECRLLNSGSETLKK